MLLKVLPVKFCCRCSNPRLDNVVFRLGLAASRAGARQLVSHKHIMVNGDVVIFRRTSCVLVTLLVFVKNQNRWKLLPMP